MGGIGGWGGGVGGEVAEFIQVAGQRMQRDGDLTKVMRLKKAVKDVTREKYTNKKLAEDVANQKIATASKKLLQAEVDNDMTAATQALLYGTGAGGAAAITGQALESIRRDMGMED